ncbi:MAG: enoyl-CoA hydratase/isomerase family protein [Pseudomonadota bacterium]
MTDITLLKRGAIGHITLRRPQALNAVTYEMCIGIEGALTAWAGDTDVKMVVIDAEGDKAFSAGGDLQAMWDTGRAGQFEYGRRFWRDEYRLNAMIYNFPKPYAAFMQGFTMGGGVGVSCHGSHRVVCETSQIAMPECGVGLVPDVGGSLLLARAPGHLGEYLGTTGARMGPGDAIYAGFADYYVPRAAWPDLIERLSQTGDWDEIDRAAQPAPEAQIAKNQALVDRHFAGASARDIVNGFDGSEFCTLAEGMMRKAAPLSVSATVDLVRRVRAFEAIEPALEMEYRFTARAAEHGDFLEGIRAAVIDKDRQPNWRHTRLEDVSALDVSRMLMPLGKDRLNLDS